MTKQCASVPYARPRWALNMAQHLYPHSSAWFCTVVYIWTLKIVNLSFLSMTHFDSIDLAVCDLAICDYTLRYEYLTLPDEATMLIN